jgi:hypothetical protein
MATNNLENITREDAIKTYNQHMRDNNQGYFKAMEAYNRKLAPLVKDSAFSFEAWKEIVKRDDLYAVAKQEASKMFLKDPSKMKSFERLLDNTRDIQYRADIQGDVKSLEGWGGGNAVYASSVGAFAMGSTPFIIGGWLAAARSEEIYQHIDNQNNMRLEFEYNMDYLQIGDEKFFYPQAYRSGEITGYNKLPKIDWVTPNTAANGTYTAPETWCGEDMFILLPNVQGALSSTVKGNFLEVCKKNVHKFGIEPNCTFAKVKYTSNGEDVVKPIRLHYDIVTGPTNERMFKSTFNLKDVLDANGNKFSGPLLVTVFMKFSLDTGDFTLMTTCGDSPDQNAVLKGLQFNGKLSNIANELTNIPTMGTDKYQFVRECEYRNYSKVSLNEYMVDNFRIGSNNNISYAAYATDKNIQSTVFNRALEAEDFLINDVLADGVDLDSFELTRKMGGHLNNTASFTVNQFAPGLGIQEYKDGLKLYLNKLLASAETDINVPASVKREWIFLGYDAIITEFPKIKFENAAVNLDEQPEGAAANENFGFAVDSRCGYVDNLGRSVRLIANNDSRWRDRGNNIYGTLRTFSMDYPFLVYYPHAIRMYTAIDADNPNRTAVYIGGREFRGVFAAAAIQFELNGVLDQAGVPVNNFAAQMSNAKTGYQMTTING